MQILQPRNVLYVMWVAHNALVVVIYNVLNVVEH
jgi:hypothetical protein